MLYELLESYSGSAAAIKKHGRKRRFARVIAVMRAIDRPTRLSTRIPDVFCCFPRGRCRAKVQYRQDRPCSVLGTAVFVLYMLQGDTGVRVVCATGVARQSGVGDPLTA